MPGKNIFKRWYIKLSRYLLRRQFLRVMQGPLKGYRWSTSSSYDYILGEYEDPETMRLFISWLKPGTVFYDIGANVGFHTFIANDIISTGKIYAFEPMPFVREIFEQHIALNKKQMKHNNIALIPIAVADAEKQVEFSNDLQHRDGNTYIKDSYVFARTTNKITVDARSLDGLMEAGYQKPDIVKIDVEGAEYDVLVGAKQVLQQYQPHILLATHDCHLPGVQQKCVQFLTELGYQVTHTGTYHKYLAGLDDYIAIHKSKL